MSWFDAGALANIAKSALKEAQKTIDKALDIKEDDAPKPSPPLDSTNESVWGSFTGSFFTDQPKAGPHETDFASPDSESFDACTTPDESEGANKPTRSDSVDVLSDSPLDSESVDVIPEEDSVSESTLEAIITKAPGRLALIENTNIIDIPVLMMDSSTDDDKTLVDVRMLEGSSSDTASTTTDVSANSSYLKKMLADAMVEKSREASPLSSEKSDLVKLGSDTSCDELETTASSDVEVISSPNGDSSRTQTPIKKTPSSLQQKLPTKKGHNRELSEASSEDSSDLDKLLKRVTEMTEVLEARESKLNDADRRNAELHERNSGLEAQLLDLTEEYTRRLSALEKKFQSSLRERDASKKQLEQVKADAATRTRDEDKEDLIKELRLEGEKLSKQQLQHGNIIKKLRAKEKEHEATIKSLKEANESLTSETERLKRSLSAKEEVERSQIEAVHNLTHKLKSLEGEALKTTSQLEDLTHKHSAAKRSLEAAKLELQEQADKHAELQLSQSSVRALEDANKLAQSQNDAVLNQLDYLRQQLARTEEADTLKERKLKQENLELQRRLEEAENRNEELTQTLLEVSKPLVRQLEALQQTYNVKMANYEKLELELTAKISDLVGKNRALASAERAAKEEGASLTLRLANAEERAGAMRREAELCRAQLQQAQTRLLLTERDLKSQIDELSALTQDQAHSLTAKDKEIEELTRRSARDVDSPSPTPSKASIPESLTDSFFDAPQYTNMFEMQMLQSNLKRREGELRQLQWELDRREQERHLLDAEIGALTGKIEDLRAEAKSCEEVRAELATLRQQYETLCQLFGEKVEETEELRLDLADVKDMYRGQIDELLRQQKDKAL